MFLLFFSMNNKFLKKDMKQKVTLIKFCYPFIANDCLFTELQRRMSLSHEHDELMNKKAHHMENLVWISKTPKNISKTRNESFAHVIVIVIVIVNVMGGRHGSIVIVHQQQQCIMLATSSKRWTFFLIQVQVSKNKTPKSKSPFQFNYYRALNMVCFLRHKTRQLVLSHSVTFLVTQHSLSCIIYNTKSWSIPLSSSPTIEWELQVKKKKKGK